MTFRAYRDMWLNKNRANKCKKEDLAYRASLAFKKALTKKKIQTRFKTIGIWLLNPQAMELKTRSSGAFQKEMQSEKEREEILDEGIPAIDMDITYYYDTEEELEANCEEDEPIQQSQSPKLVEEEENHITRFLKLPRASKTTLRESRVESLIDYS